MTLLQLTGMSGNDTLATVWPVGESGMTIYYAADSPAPIRRATQPNLRGFSQSKQFLCPAKIREYTYPVHESGLLKRSVPPPGDLKVLTRKFASRYLCPTPNQINQFWRLP